MVAGLIDGFPHVERVRASDTDEIVPAPVKPDRPRQVVAPDRTPTLETDRVRQEDVPPGTVQASHTQTGTAAPAS